MGYYIEVFESILASGEPEEIEEAREGMKKVIERFSFS